METVMTKVANAELIIKAKEELIDKIKNAIDLTCIKQILENQHNMDIGENIEVSGGDAIIHNGRIVYKMDFEVLFSLSVLFDGDGNYIPPDDMPEENIEELGNEAEDIIQRL